VLIVPPAFRGEKTAQALESHLDRLERNIDRLLQVVERGDATGDAAEDAAEDSAGPPHNQSEDNQSKEPPSKR
jgi:hypothetical protein